MRRLNVTLITDCWDKNAKNRQKVAWVKHACVHKPSVVPIGSTLEASGELVDTLVEAEGEPWIVMAQSAPRNGKAHRWGNGTPFGYFFYGKTLVIASVDEHVLSLPKQVGFITPSTDIRVMDMPALLDFMVVRGKLEAEKAELVKHTQFRSLKFVPRVAGWLQEGVAFPTERLEFSEIPTVGPMVWTVDNFGNCKTTLRLRDVAYREGSFLSFSIRGRWHRFACIPELRNVKDGQQAITVGSSGPDGDNFLELVVQGVNSGSAQKRFNLSVGTGLKVRRISVRATRMAA